VRTFIPHEFDSLSKSSSNGDRLYITPDGRKYPSVTTVSGWGKRKSIQAWRDRIGEEQANIISNRASKRGTSIHSLCEDYLRGGPAKPELPDIEVFSSLRPHLDKIDNIHCLETPLYSHHLRVAGTVDCIAEYDGRLSVIDFKTSAKPKRAEWIDNYFMQTSAYAVMFEEMTGRPVNRLVIIIGVDDHEPQIFLEKRDNWINDFIKVREEFRQTKGY
jgi:hypothetical protein